MNVFLLKRCGIFLLAALIISIVAQPQVLAATFEIRVSQVEDDAEESGGSVSTGINDLELGDKICGMRFQNVTIPPGSTITNAYIQFTVDDPLSGYTDANFWGEQDSNAPAFAATANNLSLRTKTTASVNWIDVPAWGIEGEQGYQQQTPDLSSIVQEIIDLGGWSSGNSIVFIVDGTGERMARAYQWANANGQDVQPLLHVEYTTGASVTYVSGGNDDVEESGSLDMYDDSLSFKAEWLNGIRFNNIDVPQGAEITRAYIEFTSDGNHNADTGLQIRVETHDNPPTFSDANKPSDRTLSSQDVRWYPVEAWSYASKYQTPDLSTLVQQIVGRTGWSPGNSMAFVIFHHHGERYAKATEDPDVASNPDYVPMLHIEYNDTGGASTQPIITVSANTIGASSYEDHNPPSTNFTITNSGTANLNFALTYGVSWLTLTPSTANLIPGASETIALNYDMTGLSAGTYSTTITVTDNNATNSPVEILVTVTLLDYTEPVTCGDIPVYAQNLVNPAILILLDRSGSMGDNTVAVVTDDGPKTPDLSPVVQEIIDRGGWSSGNAMAFMIEGLGFRRAFSYDSSPAGAPMLHVEYTDPGGIDQVLDLQVKQSSDDAEQRTAAGSAPNLASADLEFTWDDNSSTNPQVIGIRFENLAIEPGSTITNAYIQFTVHSAGSDLTNMLIWGEDLDDPPTYTADADNVSNRTKTSALVAWNGVEAWTTAAQQSRMDVAKDAISDLVKDRSIAWGFGTWTENQDGHDSTNDYTKVLEGCMPDNTTHQQALQDAITAVATGGKTPYWQSIKVANDYFSGVRTDENNVPYVQADCQPKFLIDITDGIGNVDPDDDTDPHKLELIQKVRTQTEALADAGVTPISVGFDLPVDQSAQSYEMAAAANEKGNVSAHDIVYALHNEDDVDSDGDDEGIPFFAYSKQELIDALDTITESVKGAIFHGSAPAPTTSADLGDVVIVAKFDASRWTGDVDAVAKDNDPASSTFGMWLDVEWTASEEMPASRKIYTIVPGTDDTIISYSDAVLATDNFACFGTAEKPIGDIINSTPVVVGTPPFYYPFDNYYDFVRQMNITTPRDTTIYIGANDGSLHAFDLETGQEQWAFIPKSFHDKLNEAGNDPLYDRCAREYCHKYFLDGSPIVGDVFDDFGSGDEWRTMLVIGQREGGAAFTALDVTYPNEFDYGDADQAVKYLWEFTDAELGETWSEPAIERVAVDGSADKAWGAFFGSGYAENPLDQPSKQAYLYGIHANDASFFWKDVDGVPINRVEVGFGDTGTIAYDNWFSSFAMPSQVGDTVTGHVSGATGIIVSVNVIVPFSHGTIELKNITGSFKDNEWIESSGGGEAQVNGTVTVGPSMLNNALASPLVVDLEADYVADRIYVGDLYGNMYRVANIGKDMAPQVSKLFTFSGAAPNENPIRAKASYAYTETDGEIWIYFGSGIFERQTDKLDVHQQYFFGLKDAQTPVTTYELNDLVSLQAKFETVQIDGEDVTVRVVEGTNPNADPWKMQLYELTFSDGPNAVGTERVITQPLVVGGIVFFTTFIPDTDICGGSGESWVFALDYKSGLAPTQPIFDLNGDGQFDGDDTIDTNGDGIGDTVPIGIKVGRGKGSNPVIHKDTLFITTTGDGDDGGGGGNDEEEFFAKKVNLPEKRIRVESWQMK